MGGKHNLANRTKNNARPSSSGRSAAMLHSSLPQFGGFSGIKDSGGLSFSFSPNEEFDTSVDENFQLALKKITKKDSTTKLKGLQELANLVKNAELNVVKAILPIWPRFYGVLVTDSDNKVREATHNVHHEIVIKVGRNFAPYLKQIMAPWFTSQYDNYPPAATAAVKAFKDTFSEAKYQEALIFCQEEILYYIYENLQVAQNIAGKPAPPQNEEGKFERILIACLQGYSLYLQKVPEEKIKESAELNLKIVLNALFWKLVKSNIILVKAAWFQVLSVILQKALFLLKDKESQVLNTVLIYLDDDEPVILPHVWECVLLATSVIPEWWRYVNMEKVFIPKLLKVLKQAGQGNAAVIYPNLLPLLSNLPVMDNVNMTQFYNSFFENMRLGLKIKSVTTSKSESTAIAVSFIECLQFLIIKTSDIDLSKSLIKNQLVPTIEWCLTDNNSCYKTIFYQTSMFVQNISRNSNSAVAQILVKFFFTNVQQMFNPLFQHKPTHNCDILLVSERQIEFIRSLKKNNRPKKGSQVKFNLNADGESLHRKTKEDIKVKKEDIRQNETYFELIDNLVVQIFEDYVNYIIGNSSKSLVEKLCLLIMEGAKNLFFETVMKKIKILDENDKFVDIYTNLFKKWLISESIYCRSVIDLVFSLLSYLEDREKRIVLDDLLKNNQPDCLMWAVSTALSHPYVENAVIQKWLEEQKIGEFLVSIAEKEIADECSVEDKNIFKLALRKNGSGDFFITRKVLIDVIEKISSSLLNKNSALVNDSCANLAAYLCSEIYTEILLLTYGDQLLITLFNISCKFGAEGHNISTETILEINAAWQDALIVLLDNLDKNEREILIGKIAEIVENQFFLSSVKSKEQVENLAKVIVLCLKAFHQSTSAGTSVLMELIFQRPWMSRNKMVVEVCRAAEYVKGNLSSVYHEILVNDRLDELDILHYIAWNYVKFYVLYSEMDSTEESYDEDYTDNGMVEGPKQIRFFNVIDNSENNLLEALYACTVGDAFLAHFTNVKYYNEIFYYNSWLEKKLQETFYNLDEHTLAKAKIKLKENCRNLEWFWFRAVHTLYKKLLKIADFKAIDQVHENENISEIPIQNIDEKIKNLIKKMEDSRKDNMSEFFYDDPENISWEKAEKLIISIRECSKLIKYCSFDLASWDFIVISLVSWISNCLKARALVNKIQYQAMLISVSQLYINICVQVEKFKEESVNTSCVNEWNDVLLESIHADLIQVWFYLADQLSLNSKNGLLNVPLMQYFGPVTEHFRHEFIFKINDNSPKWTKFFKKSCSLLTNSQTTLQIWGYRMLNILVPGLIKIDTEAVNTQTPHKKGLIFEQFKEKLIEVQSVVNRILMDFSVGENTCRIEPSYDTFTYAFAYLLLWNVMLCLCEQASAELRYQYADWLKNGDLLQCFLSNLFKLMPPEMSQNNEGKSKPMIDNFFKNPLDSNCYNKFCDSEIIERMVCYLYKMSLVQLPALVRQWWTDLDIKASQLVDKVTTLHVSPHLCMEELNYVMQYQNAFKNMKVKVMPGIREILAVYTVDETQMELTITLPANYPLGSPDIHCNKQISGANQKQWLLQFKKCVLHQNGRIWDGLSLWNNNLDKKFSGVEECFICYAVLHFGTCQLPRLSCQTCKKKFHSACLYKWFSTSNKSSCPICRNLF